MQNVHLRKNRLAQQEHVRLKRLQLQAFFEIIRAVAAIDPMNRGLKHLIVSLSVIL